MERDPRGIEGDIVTVGIAIVMLALQIGVMVATFPLPHRRFMAANVMVCLMTIICLLIGKP